MILGNLSLFASPLPAKRRRAPSPRGTMDIGRPRVRKQRTSGLLVATTMKSALLLCVLFFEIVSLGAEIPPATESHEGTSAESLSAEKREVSHEDKADPKSAIDRSLFYFYGEDPCQYRSITDEKGVTRYFSDCDDYSVPLTT